MAKQRVTIAFEYLDEIFGGDEDDAVDNILECIKDTFNSYDDSLVMVEEFIKGGAWTTLYLSPEYDEEEGEDDEDE